MAWLKGTILFHTFSVGLLLLHPTQLLAQSGEEPSNVMPQPEDFTADLIPNNNTIVDQLPATFYCLLTDTTLSMNISTDWYIDGAPLELGQFIEYTRIEPSGMNTNLTIFSFGFNSVLVPSINVSCRTSIFPNVTYGFYQVENPGFTPVTVVFEEEIVNGSEGNIVVVCASAFFPEQVLRLFEGSLQLAVDVSIIDQGSAETSDYGPLPSTLTFTSRDRRRCFRILLTNDTVDEGTESLTLELSHNTSTRSTIGNNAILIPMEMNRTVVQILETCIDGEIRLRGGFDENQGRVEICYKREWGTVCDDGGWAEGGRQNAQVVCQQLGLESQGAQSLSFTGAVFGPGSIFSPIHLDNVFCNGNESNLLNCRHNPVSIHDCSHSQDVSVDCLGRSQVGAPCSSVDEIRLVGGVDEFQGRVEVCTEAMVYSTVCSSGWDIRDAEVVCRQLGLGEISALAARDALFGLGVGTISYQNVNCAGSERNFSQCINGQTSTSCTHFQDAGVECLGRPLPGAPLVGFERTAQDNGNLLAIREGETLELCVILLSGSLETVIQVFTSGTQEDFRNQATQAIDELDFIVQPPTAVRERGVYQVFFDVNTTRSCFNVTAIDDSIAEDALKTVEFRINQTRVNQIFIQVSPSAATARLGILDDDFNCDDENGMRCIEPLNARAFCLRSTLACNGIPECSDGSDESNCTDYCAEAGIEGFNCAIERRCIPQEHFCDGVPDCGLDVMDERLGCTDGCTHGEVRPSPLLNDTSVSEGLFDVCVNGTYLPVSLDNGRFSVREVTVLCKQLELGNAGIPLSGGSIGANIQAERLAQIKCTGNENSISSCNITSAASALIGNQPARVRCFFQESAKLSCEDGMIRLSGPSHNEGRVEMCYQNIWGAVYDQSWSGFDAAVVCAQLNFSRAGALPITGVLYGPVDRVPFVYARPICVGNETSLLDCPSVTQQQLGQTGFYQDQNNGLENNYVAVRCEDFPASNCDYLDAQLTFRRANSTGHLEICNREGQWSVVCGISPIPVENIRVICNQLGFDPFFVRLNNLSQSTSVLNIGRPIINVISGLRCRGNESNLAACPQIEVPSAVPGTFQKRQAAEPVPITCNSLEIQCGAPPRIIFNPPSINRVYEAEIGRRFSMSCSFDQNIYPAPGSFGVSRLNGNISMTRRSGNSHQVIASEGITLVDADTYYCNGTYGNEQVFEESVNVTVRGLTGTADSAYLRVSFQTFERLRTNGLIFSSNQQLLNQLPVLAFELIPERVPGVHNVDYCRIVNRREFDIQRRLDRAECKVTQYSNLEERVTSVFIVVEHVARFIPRSVAVFVDPVDISATGFCDAEIISSGSGTTFYWPETRGGVTATFTCPSNQEVVVTRSCRIGGLWSQFDESACDGISGQLSNLIDLFSNLTTETYETAVSTLSSVIELSESNKNEQNSEVLSTVANYTAELATFVDDSSVIINDTVVQNMVEVVSSLLQWNPANIAIDSSSSVLQSFEEVVSRYAQQLSLNQNQTITVPSLVIVAELRSTQAFTDEGRTFTISGSTPSLDQTLPGQLSSQQNAAIRLPPSLFEELNNLPNVGVFFGRYEMSTLFPVGRASNNGRQTEVGSQVLAATVGQNLRLQNLSEPVTVTLKLQSREGLFMANGSEACVSWDFDLLQWTTRGCNTSVGLDGIITCRCNHLTNFAVLVDMCTREENCQPATRDCEAEVIRSETGTTYEWPLTAEGGVANFSCPLMDAVIISRRCGVGGVWQAFSEEACGVVNEQLNRLNNSFNNLTTETVETAVALLAQAVEQTEGREVEQNGAVLSTVADYLTDVATFVNNPNITINSTVVESVAQVVSSLLQWNPENVAVASSSRVVQSFEIVVYLFAQQLGLNETQNITLNSLTVIAELRSRESLANAGRSFAIGNNEFMINDEDQVMPGQLSPRQDAAISLPASLFQTIDDREDVGIFFALYNTSTLFPVDGGINRNAPRRREVGSRVLAATVGPGLNFPNLEENVTIVLRIVTTEFTAPGSEMCVSWSFTLQDWTTEGCTINVTQLEEGIVTCSCNHLTNFAVLVDVCSRQENCQPLNPVVSDLLTYVSYIGISISIVSLTVTIVTLLIFKKLRQKDASKYHIQLSLAMLFMLVVSLALVSLSVRNVTDPYGGCVMVSILVHYFTLVAVMWMGAEALLMFQKLVIIFTRVTTKFMVYVSVICWTVPILFVIIPLIVDLATGNSAENDIIVRRPNGTEDISFCFLSHPGAFWGAFLVPIFAVMLFNIIVFIWVIVILVRHTRGTAARKKEAVSNKTIIRLMISISGVMFLFGLTWLFAILTFSTPGLRETFQILFTVFNSFQGFFIFLFFCIFNKEAVESWKELLSCGKYKSKVLHPSQVKLSSTAVTKKVKQSKTGSTGFTLSSGGKFASQSETSRSDYEASTLMKGNVYEKAPFETKVDLGTTDSTVENPVVEDKGLTETASEHTEATTVPVVIVEQTDSGNGDLQNKDATSTREEGEKKKKAMSLKARIKRYSTKKISKHHVEEVEVDFDSDNSSQESGGEEDTTTQL